MGTVFDTKNTIELKPLSHVEKSIIIMAKGSDNYWK